MGITDLIDNWYFVALIALRTSTVSHHIPKSLYNSLFTDILVPSAFDQQQHVAHKPT